VAFVDMAYLAEHPGFRERVRIAMITAAVDIGAEANDGSEYRRLRRAHSVNVLQNQDAFAGVYAWVVASNVAISFTSSDSDIQFTVNSRWDAVAGAAPDPVP